MKTFISRFIALMTLAGAVALSSPAFAQNAVTVTPESTTYSTDGGTMIFDVAITYPAVAPTALTFAVTVPTGWTFAGAAGSNVPDVTPSIGDGGTLGFLYVTVPADAAHFTISLDYPAAQTGDLSLTTIASSLRPGPLTLSASDVTVTLAPYIARISTPPAGSTVDAGQPLSLSVSAAGYPAPTYQWSKDGTPIAGATDSTFSVASAQLADAGSYTVTLTNSEGSVTSAAAVAVVQAAPAITLQPADTMIIQGQTGSLSVSVTGYPVPSYQWSFNGTAISGATNATLSIPSAQTGNAGAYAVAIANSKGAVTSRTAAVTVTIPATITQQPLALSLVMGSPATFSVKALGTAPLSYQWKRGGAAIAGATAATYAIPNTGLLDAGFYSVVVSNSVGSVTSNVVHLDVSAASPLNPVVTTPPGTEALAIGQSATLSVAASATGTLSYQWYKDGDPIAGATTANYSISSVKAGDAGNYTVLTWAPGSANVSTKFAVTVGAAPAVTTTPAAQVVRKGDSASLTVAATGATPLSYQWNLDGEPIDGATTAVLAVANAQAADEGTYTVTVSNAFGSVTTAPTTLTLDYSGAYFGTLGIDQGSWALYVDRHRTGTFIAYLAGSQTALVETVTLDAAGSFTTPVAFSQSAPKSTAFSSGFSPSPKPTALATSGVLSGQISGSACAGQISGVDLTLSGSLDAAPGTPSAATGYYVGAAVDAGTGSLYCIVGPSGKEFVVLVDGATADFAAGTVDSDGQFSASTVGGTSLALKINAAAQNVSGTVSGPSGTTSFYAAPATASSRLVNLSASAGVGPNNVALGFVIKGGTKAMLVRGVGPSLSLFGVKAPLADPVLSLFGPSGVLAMNAGWGGSTALSQLFNAVGAFPFPTWTSDTAVARSLGTGSYSIQVSSVSDGSGAALAEVYDTDGETYTGRLVNASAMASISSTNMLSGGFVIAGNAPERVLIRGIGPALAGFGVGRPLAAPRLTVFGAAGKVIASNVAWGGSASLSDTFGAVGAFPLPVASNDTAVLLTLAPGLYTAQITAADGGAGSALLEIYEVP